MKHTLFFFLLAAMPLQAVQWENSPLEAMQYAKSEKKPLVLFFTGTDWCLWCDRLENETFKTKEFTDAAGASFVFAKVDFPSSNNQNEKVKEENLRLKDAYGIKSFPAVVILDSSGKTVGMTGYKQGGGASYAAHLLKMTQDFEVFKEEMARMEQGLLNGKQIKRLYQKANELNRHEESRRLIEAGIHSDMPHLFLTEKYRLLVDSGQGMSPEAGRLKKRIFEADPENKKLCHYQVAVIDFEACSQSAESSTSPEQAAAPLIGYLESFGQSDPQNRWRLNMTVSQVFLNRECYEKALRFAKEAKKCAPESVKGDIALTIDKIKTKLQ